MSKKVLLLGGTGAIGVYLQEYLQKAPETEIYITSRSKRISSEKIHYLQGNAHDFSFLEKILTDIKPDAIVDFMVWNSDNFKQASSLLLKNTGHYLFLSSYRVFAEQNPLTENSPRLLDVCDNKEYLKTDEYGLTKARQENILRKSNFSNWTILRPSITYSKNRFQFGCLEANVLCLRSLQNLPVVIPTEMLEKRTTLTWAGDTAKLICKLILNTKAYKEDFNLATTENHTWREIANFYNEFIGTTIKEISLKQYIKILGSQWQIKYDRMFNRTLDNTKVLNATDVEQRDFMSLYDGFKKELTELKKHPYFRNLNIKQNALVDNICNTSISLKGYGIKDIFCYKLYRYPHITNFLPIKTIKNIMRLLRRK